MQAKIYLQGIKRLREDARTCKELADNCHMSDDYRAISYDKPGVQTSSSGDAMADEAGRMDEQIRELTDRAVDDLKEVNKRVKMILDMEQDTERTILIERYVHDLTYEEIAERMHYSLGYVTNMHGRALQDFQARYVCE